jgi:hypothetical protein
MIDQTRSLPAGLVQCWPAQSPRCGRGPAAVPLALLVCWLTGAPTVRAGELEQFFYAPLNGGTVAELTAAPEFPEQPFVVTPVNWFNTGLEGLTNASFHYGSWLRGYLEAPVTGNYVFYLSADDSAEFHLSTYHAPANQRLVASVASPVPHAAYDRQYDQRSVPIALERGRQYYFELLHKQSAGTDHVQVGWLRPDDVLERPIPLRYVQRFVPASYQGPAVREPAALAPWIALPPPEAGRLHSRANQHVVLAPHVSARPPVAYQWWEDGVPLPGENLSSLDLGAVGRADDGRVFQLQVTTAAGSTLSEDWRLRVAADVTPPALASATVAGMIDGFVLRFSEPVDPVTATNAANYTLNLGITVNSVSLLHGTNQTAVVVRTSPFPLTGRPEVTVHGVRDLAQPPNEIAPGSTLLISQAEGRITLRYTGAIHGRPPVGGTSIDQVVVAGHFQYDPVLTTVRTELGIPPNFADNYAAQLIGYLIPPVTGDYRFWIASDDQGILYLSPDADPAKKRAIALEPQWSGWRNYLGTERRSMATTGNSAFIFQHFPGIAPDARVNDSLNTVGWIHLEAGRRYYIEALMKEGGGEDNLDIAWQMPGGPPVVNGQAPIPGEFLAQWAGGITGEVVITNQPAAATALEGRRVTYSVGVTGTPPYEYQWFRNGVRIVDATAAEHTFPARLTDHGARYAVRVRNDFSEVWSQEATLQVWPDGTRPRIIRAQADQHFDKVTLRFDEPVTAATATNPTNYTITRTDNGQPLIVTGAQVGGFGDGGWTNVVLRTGPIESGVNYTVRTSGIRDLSVAENATRPEEEAYFTGWVISRGFVLYERYHGIGGISIAQLRVAPKYPDHPDAVQYLNVTEAPANVADNYGARLSGFFFPDVSGEWNLYLAADEQGELWLSTDSSPVGLQRIASEPAWGNRRSWTGTSDGRRADGENHTLGRNLPVMTMVAGEPRYFEALLKEGGGGDYLDITSSRPGEPPPANSTPSNLRGQLIGAWANPDAMSITLTQEPADVTTDEGTLATFSVSASATDWDGRAHHSLHFQWQTNGVDVAGANGFSHVIPGLNCGHDGLRVRCLVSAPGATVATREALVTVVSTGPFTVTQVNGTPQMDRMRIRFSSRVDAATALDRDRYQIEGLAVLSARLLPSEREVELTTSPQVPGRRYVVHLSGLTKPGPCPNPLEAYTGDFAAWTLQSGWVLRERWTNLGGVMLANLTQQVRFAGPPDMVDFLPAVESPQTDPNQDNYGQRLSGFLQVTNTGDYLFAIAADDQAVFYLSTDENPANKRAVVAEPEWQSYRDWNSFDRRIGSSRNEFFPHITTLPVNQSANTVGAIQLVAGEHYYFEVLHKEGGGGDHVAVTMWPTGSPPPGNNTPGINGARVWNYLPADEEIEIVLQPMDYVVRDGHSASFSVAARARHSPVQFQWQRNGVAIQGATQSVLNLAAVTGWEDGSIIRCRLTAAPVTRMSAPARLRVISSREFRAVPTLHGGLNLVWGDDGTPVLLQSTTNLFPAPEWITRNWSDQRDGLLHFFAYPKGSYAPAQEFFRVVPAE